MVCRSRGKSSPRAEIESQTNADLPQTNGRTLEQMDEVFKDNTGEFEIARRARIETDLTAELAQRTTPSVV
jgi:hypothetical protein